jgi:DNA repair exonuclease SbcCD nuclease subunit
MFTFLHAADIHLDSPLRGIERYEQAPVEQLRGATRRALENLVDLALRERVGLVLIAGDLYDDDWDDFRTGLFFAAQVARLDAAGIPTVIVAGNHDAANRMTRRLPLPKRATLLLPGQPQTVRIEACRVAIHGQSFGERATRGNLAAGYPPPIRGWFNVGLLHTSLTGREGHDPYAPCSLDDLRAKEYDYWALGHIHKSEVLCLDPPIVFPGNLQGRNIRETGPKGCMLVRVDGRRTALEARPLDVLRWEVCTIDVSGAETEDELVERIRRGLDEGAAMAEGRLRAVRVHLQGATPLCAALCAEADRWSGVVRALAFQVGGVWVEKLRLDVSPPPQVDRSQWADLPLGDLMEYVAEVKNSPEAQAALAGELKDFLARLPSDLRTSPGLLGLDPPERFQRTLDEVGQMLIHQLAMREAAR